MGGILVGLLRDVMLLSSLEVGSSGVNIPGIKHVISDIQHDLTHLMVDDLLEIIIKIYFDYDIIDGEIFKEVVIIDVITFIQM